MSLELVHLLGPDGTTINIGGLTQRIWVAPIGWFSSIAKKKELNDSPAPTDPAELINIDDDHTFILGKGFVQIYNTRDKGKVEYKNNEERDTNGATTEASIMHPGVSASVLGVLTIAENERLIALFEFVDGKRMQVGSERFYAELKFSFDGGNNESGYRGVTIKIKGFESSFQLYNGTITEKPGSSS
jgi:hypothetical protein